MLNTIEDENGVKGRSQLMYLLLSLIFILLVVPVLEHGHLGRGLLRLGITAVLVTAAFALARRRQLLIAGLIVAGIAAPMSWSTMFIDQPALFLASCILEAVFFVGMAVFILVTVMQKHLATVDSIFGAISAYLLIGLAWAVLYWGLDRVDSSALHFTQPVPANATAEEGVIETTAFSQLVYFSFVTMSTLGYGDVSPRTPVAQTLAWMQSVIGQFYLAVLVAWVVSEIPRRKPKTAS